MLQIIPIPAFDDNYIWLLRHGQHAVVVDPGDAAPVLAYLKQHHLTLSAILITHHHSDHIDGVKALQAHSQAFTYAPSYERFDFPHVALKAGDQVHLPEVGLILNVLHLPGHTLGHIAYVNDDYLFCGDTLFGAGCGRLFEGTPAQMLASLTQLKRLPPSTQVFCTHEYTATNIAFALQFEPGNPDLIARHRVTTFLRGQNIPTLPSTIGLELATNPFLRCDCHFVVENSDAPMKDELSVFTQIRHLRNLY